MAAPAASTPVFTFLSKIDLFCLAKARPCVNNGLTLLLLSLFTQSYSIALYSDYIVWWITRLNKAAGSSAVTFFSTLGNFLSFTPKYVVNKHYLSVDDSF